MGVGVVAGSVQWARKAEKPCGRMYPSPSVAGHPLTFTHQTCICSQRSQPSVASGRMSGEGKKNQKQFPKLSIKLAITEEGLCGKQEQMRCRREVSDHSDCFSFRPKSRIVSFIIIIIIAEKKQLLLERQFCFENRLRSFRPQCL